VTDTRDTLETEAINLAHNIYRRLTDIEDFAVTTAGELRSEILASATLHVRNLNMRRNDTAGIGSARVVCRALFGDNDPPSNWWRTALAQDVAWVIGYPAATTTVAGAVDVLGCSRSYVLRLIREGRLATNSAGDVVAVSLRDYIRQTTAAANRGGNMSGRWA
jgi:hypothetical protein